MERIGEHPILGAKEKGREVPYIGRRQIVSDILPHTSYICSSAAGRLLHQAQYSTEPFLAVVYGTL